MTKYSWVKSASSVYEITKEPVTERISTMPEAVSGSLPVEKKGASIVSNSAVVRESTSNSAKANHNEYIREIGV
ncbi:hypothetical protein GCM10023151_12440 [Kangiella marina]|uniref:Uncharacterized protein n=1 Tax=Kangiella marina TaxID=1079178 RepID=A0ABP8IJH7_9GAMM